RVGVDPLVIAGRVGEPVDLVLGDVEPLSGAELLAHRVQQLVRGAEGTPTARTYFPRCSVVSPPYSSASTIAVHCRTMRARRAVSSVSRFASPSPRDRKGVGEGNSD